MTECTHTRTNERWVTEDDGYGDTISYWDYKEESTCIDIDIGRYKCTRCNKIMYYTGLWKQHWEGKNA